MLTINPQEGASRAWACRLRRLPQVPERSAWSSLAWGRGGVSGEPERAGNGAAAGGVSPTFFLPVGGNAKIKQAACLRGRPV